MKWPAAHFLAVTDDGSMLACSRRDDVVVVDLRAEQILYRCRPIQHPWGVAFSPAGDLLAVDSANGPVAFLDAMNGTVVSAVPDSFVAGCEPSFAPDGNLLDGNWDGDLTLYRQTGEVVDREQHKGEKISRISHDMARQAWLVQHTRRPISAAHSPTDYLTVRHWPDWNVVRYMHEIEGHVASATLSPNGLFVAYLKRWENMLHIVGAEDGKIVAVRGPIETGGTGFELAWSPDCRHIGIVTKRGFSFFDMVDEGMHGLVLCKYPSALAFLPDGKSVVLGTWERSAVFDLDSVMAGQRSL